MESGAGEAALEKRRIVEAALRDRVGELVRRVLLLGWWLLRSGEGFGDVVEVVGGAVYADERGIAFAVVVIDVGIRDEGIGLQDEVDGFGFALGVFDGGLEGVAGEDVAVDGDDLLTGE
jgi:hypothetical protein